MRKDEIKQRAGDIVRDAVREREIASNVKVLGYVPDMLDSVSIDTRYILSCVDNELNKRTANPLNALLGLFGLRIVHPKNTISDLSAEFGSGTESGVTLEVEDNSKMASFLRVDEAQLKSAIGKMADELRQVESDQQSMQHSLREQNASLHKEMDKASGQLTQKSTDLNYQRNAVAERAQYMLSLVGESPSDTTMCDQIKELLADLELSAHWTTTSIEQKETAMFSILKCDEPEKRRNKPCIMSGSDVFLKGVRFVANENGSEPSHEQAEESANQK